MIRTITLLSIVALCYFDAFSYQTEPCNAENRCISAEAMVEQDIDESEVSELVAQGWVVGE